MKGLWSLMKKGNWFWGVFFLCAAALVIVHRLGLLTFGQNVTPFTMFFGVVLTAAAIKSAVHRQFAGLLFSLALLCIVFSGPFPVLNAITPWPVLIAALLGSVGLHMMFRGAKWKKRGDNIQPPPFRKHPEISINDTDTGSFTQCTVRFGSGSKYLHTNHLERVDVNCSFGAAQVYFDHAQLANNSADVVLNVSFGGVELYVPRHWRIKNGVAAVIGGVDVRDNFCAEDAPTLNLAGNVTFGGVEIHYV